MNDLKEKSTENATLNVQVRPSIKDINCILIFHYKAENPYKGNCYFP